MLTAIAGTGGVGVLNPTARVDRPPRAGL